MLSALGLLFNFFLQVPKLYLKTETDWSLFFPTLLVSLEKKQVDLLSLLFILI